MTYFQSKQNGFTLVETLVAITILLIVITGPMTIMTSSARSTSFSSEQVIASFLAQEGLELAQKARDDLMLEHLDSAGSPWSDFETTFNTCFDLNGCGLEVDGDSDGSIIQTTSNCGTGGANCVLNFDAGTTGPGGSHRSRYTHAPTGSDISETPFTRTIKFELGGVANNEVKVTSTVTWRTGSQRATQQVAVENVLFNVYGE